MKLVPTLLVALVNIALIAAVANARGSDADLWGMCLLVGLIGQLAAGIVMRRRAKAEGRGSFVVTLLAFVPTVALCGAAFWVVLLSAIGGALKD